MFFGQIMKPNVFFVVFTGFSGFYFIDMNIIWMQNIDLFKISSSIVVFASTSSNLAFIFEIQGTSL